MTVADESVGAGDLLPRHIMRVSRTRVFARRVYALLEVDSTNRLAAELARAGETEGALVVADHQTKGRGRWERQWESPAGRNLLFSLILRPGATAGAALPVTLAFSAAIAETLGALTGRDIGVKWPNDVIAGERKVCGILSEGSTFGDRTEYIVVGIGINVNMRIEEFPEECRDRSCSCYTLTGREWDRADVLGRVLTALEGTYDEFSARGFGGLVGRYKSRLAILGRDIGYKRRGRPSTARVVDVGSDGGLVVETSEGLTTLYDDEVTLLPGIA